MTEIYNCNNWYAASKKYYLRLAFKFCNLSISVPVTMENGSVANHFVRELHLYMDSLITEHLTEYFIPSMGSAGEVIFECMFEV